MTTVALTCILQTLWTLVGESPISKEVAREIISHLFERLNIQFPDNFESIFKDETIHRSAFLNFISKIFERITEVQPSDIEKASFDFCHNHITTTDTSESELESLWVIFCRLSDASEYPPIVKDENTTVFYLLLKKSSYQEHILKNGTKYKLTFSKLVNLCDSETQEKTDLYISEFISCLEKIVIQTDRVGWVYVKCSRNKSYSKFTKRWCCLKDYNLYLYNTKESVFKPHLHFSISSNIKLKLLCDKQSLQPSICLTLENGLVYQLKASGNSTQNWFRSLEAVQSSRKSKTVFPLRESRLNTSMPNIYKGSSSPSLFIESDVPVRESAELKDGFKQVRDRWDCFISLKRQGNCGKTMMTTRTRILADVAPGDYKLKDLMPVRDLPPLRPKHTVVKNVQWIRKKIGQASGKIVFPHSFNEYVVIEYATSEFLSYYGCTFADMSSRNVSLSLRHGIQDFDYKRGYLEEFVLKNSTGAGIEKHDFTHLDCPLEEDSGFFILGEMYDENELHLTAFKIPPLHTLFVPRGCIHSNDYLQGVWRTMLSDEADIDHVTLVKRLINSKKADQFHFKFY